MTHQKFASPHILTRGLATGGRATLEFPAGCAREATIRGGRRRRTVARRKVRQDTADVKKEDDVTVLSSNAVRERLAERIRACVPAVARWQATAPEELQTTAECAPSCDSLTSAGASSGSDASSSGDAAGRTSSCSCSTSSVVSSWEDWVDSSPPAPAVVADDAVAADVPLSTSATASSGRDASSSGDATGRTSSCSCSTSSVVSSWEDWVDSSPPPPAVVADDAVAADAALCSCSSVVSSWEDWVDSSPPAPAVMTSTAIAAAGALQRIASLSASISGCPDPTEARSSRGCAPHCGAPDNDVSNRDSSGGGGSTVSSSSRASLEPGDSQDEVEAVGVSYYLNNGTFIQTLGEGGFGRADLYSVTMPDGSSELVVIKTLLQEKHGEYVTAALHREAAGLRLGASCPYIVDIYACSKPSSPDEAHQLVMEYVPGGTLDNYIYKLMLSRRYLKRGEDRLMSYTRLRKLAAQMLEALALLHSNNMCHCDLKPENILLSKDEDGAVQYKLVDFGLAQAAMADGTLAIAAGSLQFMALETCSHIGRMLPDYPLTINQDLANLGFLLAYCGGLCIVKCGLPSFRHDGASLPETWDASFSDLVLQLTRRNPWERISAQAALEHPFITAGRKINQKQIATRGKTKGMCSD